MHSRPRTLVSLALAGSLTALPALAQADPPAADLEARIAFLEDRIETQRTHAEVWWTGWLTFYSAGMVVQGVRASRADNAIDRADLWVSFVKASGGVVRMLADPYQGIRGIEPSPRWSEHLAPTMRLARAERILQHNADQTSPFGPWYAHLINLGVNGLGGVIVGAGFDGWQQGMISAAIGFGVGEVNILTGPWEADGDLQEYNERFRPRLSVRPMGTGAALHMSF